MTKTGIQPEQGEIVLIPVPFTDLSSHKRRPVVVISNDDYNRHGFDLIAVAMTSNPAVVPYSFKISSKDIVDGSLNRPGTIRVDKVYTLAQSLVAKRFARVSLRTLERIHEMFIAVTTPGS
jgi:mRNA interferase MazF